MRGGDGRAGGGRRDTGAQDLPLVAQNRNGNMNNSNSSDGPHQSPGKKRRYLTAEKKFQIYLEAQASDKPVSDLLPGQPKKFAILAEGPLEDMRRLQAEIERLTAEIAVAA